MGQVSARSPCLAESHDVPALSLMPFSIRGRETSSPTRSDLAEPCGVVIADVEAASGGWPAVQHFAPGAGPVSWYEAGVVTWSRAQQDPPRTRLCALTAARDRALACEGRPLSSTQY